MVSLGVVGLALLLLGFAGSTRPFASTVWWHWANTVGGALMSVYAVSISAWLFVPLELAWTGIAVCGLYGHVKSYGRRREVPRGVDGR